MLCNLAPWERYPRLIFAALMIAWALLGGPPWAWLGVYPGLTGAFRFSPVRWYFRRTARRARREREEIESLSNNEPN